MLQPLFRGAAGLVLTVLSLGHGRLAFGQASVTLTSPVLDGSWSRGYLVYASPTPLHAAAASFPFPIAYTWTVGGSQYSFNGTLTVTVDAAPPPGQVQGNQVTFGSKTLAVNANLTGNWTWPTQFMAVNYAQATMAVMGDAYTSLDETLVWPNPCRIPASSDMYASYQYPSSPAKINLSVPCNLTRLAAQSANQYTGHVSFELQLGPGDASEMYIGGYVNFSYTAQTNSIDLSVDRIEFNQATQTEARDVPLVAGKDTVVRVFVKTANDVAGVDGVLRWYPAGGVPSAPVASYNGPITAHAIWGRNAENDSLNFRLPPEWVASGGTLQIQAEVLTPAGMVDSNPANNVASYTAPLTTQASDFSVQYMQICYQPPGVADSGRTCPQPGFGAAQGVMRAMYPLDGRKFRYEPLILPPKVWHHRLQTDTSPNAKNPFADDDPLEAALRKFLFVSGIGWLADQTAAWLPEIPGWETLGSSDPIWGKNKLATGRFFFGQWRPGVNERDSESTLAHEIGHNLGLHHPNLVAGKPRPDACKAGDATSLWPYQNSTAQESGFDTGARQPVWKPFSLFDFMTWCNEPNLWISPFDYNWLLGGNFQPSSRTPAPEPESSAKAPALEKATAAAPVSCMLVSGTVSQDNSSASLNPLYKVTGTPVAGQTGAYCVRVSQTGKAPADTCFDLSFQHPEQLTPIDQQSFTFLAPWVDGASRVALLYNGQELTAIIPSAHAPTVSITSPQAGQSWDGGTRTIAWTASDADGDSLTFSVLYSADNGATWLSLAEDITDMSLDLDPSLIQGGSQVKFRVMVTDGFNNASADAGPISVVQRPALAITPTPVNAHGAMVGQSRLTPVVVANSGSGPLQVSNVTSGNAAFQVASPPFPFLIESGGQREIDLRFTPPAAGAVTGTLTFSSNDASQPAQNVGVQGTGLTAAVPDAQVMPATLDFGPVTVGVTATSGVVLRNYGPGTLTVSSATVADAQFSLNGVSTPFNLEPDDLPIAITFTPSQAGPRSSTLTIASNDPNQPTQRVTLQGTGVAAATGPVPAISSGGVVEGAQFKGPVTPGGIASLFGSQLAGGLLSASATPLPTNLGGTSVLVKGVPAPLFFVSPAQINFQVPFEILAGATADVVVARNGLSSPAQYVSVTNYAPAVFMNPATQAPIVTRYPNNDVITAANPAQPNDVLTIYLTGIGDLTGKPTSGAPTSGAQLYAARINPVVQVGATAATVLFAGLTPGFIGLAQINAQLPANLALGPTLPLLIQFGSVASVPVQLPVRGNGTPAAVPSVSVSPASLDFGAVTAGQTKSLTLLVRNSGNAALTVSGMTIPSGPFAMSPLTVPFVVAAGGTQTVTVQFTPSAAGAQTGTLTIASNDPAQPSLAVPLSGTGVAVVAAAPKITVTPAALDFGSVNAGATASLTLTVGNTGNAPLTVSGIASGNASFAATAPALPFNVAAGAQQAVTIRFSPTAAGVQSGTLAVASNDPATPTANVAVTGTGVAVVASTVLFSDSFNRPDADMCSLGAADLAHGGSGVTYYMPIYPQGAEIHQATLWNGNRDYAGVEFTLMGSPCSPSTATWLRQDLDIQVDLLVPGDAGGDASQAGAFFRSSAVLPNGIVNGPGSAGYWVQLLNTGEVKVELLNPQSVVAFTGRPAQWDATVYHTLEMSVQGGSLQVALDGKLMTFNQGGVKVTTVAAPAVWDGPPAVGTNNGAAGILFGAEGNRGNIGGQRARNLVVSTVKSLGGLPVQSNLP